MTTIRSTSNGNAGRSKGKTESKKSNPVLDDFREAEGEYTEKSRVESNTLSCRRQQPRPAPFAITLPAPAVRAVRAVGRKRERDVASSTPVSVAVDEEEDEPAPQRRRRKKSQVSGRRKAVVVDEDAMDIDTDEEDRGAEVVSNGKAGDNVYQSSGIQERLERPVHQPQPVRANIGLYYGEAPTVRAAQATPSATSMQYDPRLQFATPAIFAQYKSDRYRNRTCRTTISDFEQEEAEMIGYEHATIARQQAKAKMTATEYQRTTAKQTGMPAPKNFSPRVSTPFLPDPESAQYALEHEYRGVPTHRLPAELSVHAQPTQFQKWKGYNMEKMAKGNVPGWLEVDGYDEAFLEEGLSISSGGSSTVATPFTGVNTEAAPTQDQATAAANSSQGNAKAVNTAASKQPAKTTALTPEGVRAALESAPHEPAEVKLYKRTPGIQTLVHKHGSPVIKPYDSHVVCGSMSERVDRAITDHPNFQLIKSKMYHHATPEVPNIILYKVMWYFAHNTKEIRESRDFVPRFPKMSLDRWDGMNHLACHFTTVEKFTISNVLKVITDAYHFYPHKSKGEDELHAELVVDPESVKLRWKRNCGGGKQDEVLTSVQECRWSHDVEDIQADNFVYGTLIIEFGVRNINESERQQLLSSMNEHQE